jgi:RNA polymerase sigma factor (sigma-70 family)
VEDPESVTHEVFLALYQVFDRIEGGDGDVRTMTFSIAHARVVDHHRARARQPYLVGFDPDSDPRHSPSAEESAADRLGARGVFELVDTLGDEQREAVLLRIVAGLTLEETAQIMDKSVGAIKQLQRRALESLRNSLAGEANHD